MNKYENLEIEIVALNTSDILTQSLNVGAGDNEGSFNW